MKSKIKLSLISFTLALAFTAHPATQLPVLPAQDRMQASWRANAAVDNGHAMDEQGGPINVTVTEISPEAGSSFGHNGGFIFNGDTGQIVLPTKGRVFRSLNGGRDWHRLNLPEDIFGDPSPFVRQDPANSDVLFARFGRKVYRSHDFGTSWTQIRVGFLVDLSVLGAPPGIVLALRQTEIVDESGLEYGEPIWASVDGGLTFEPRQGTGLPKAIIASICGTKNPTPRHQH